VSGVVSNLAVLSLLAHMVLGCCWHHAHASRQDPTSSAPVADLSGGHDHPDSLPRQRASHPEAAGGEHDGRHGCSGNRCVGLVDLPTRTLTPSARQSLELPAACQAFHCGPAVPEATPAKAGPLTGRCLSVRIHLLHQVLLI
jgi:hypothetical protein